MTRYFLFEYDDYYPCGGFDDLTGIFESEGDVLAEIKGKSVWEDNIDIYSLDSDNDRPEFLYRRLSVLDEFDRIWSVIGNSEKKIIRLVIETSMGKARWPESYKDAKVSDFKMEVE